MCAKFSKSSRKCWNIPPACAGKRKRFDAEPGMPATMFRMRQRLLPCEGEIIRCRRAGISCLAPSLRPWGRHACRSIGGVSMILYHIAAAATGENRWTSPRRHGVFRPHPGFAIGISRTPRPRGLHTIGHLLWPGFGRHLWVSCARFSLVGRGSADAELSTELADLLVGSCCLQKFFSTFRHPKTFTLGHPFLGVL